MKKYYDIDHDILYTESELKRIYDNDNELHKEYDSFVQWLNACLTINNGSLEPVADDVWIRRLQRNVASDIACVDMPYDKCLEVIQKANLFSTWSINEINNRPVDVDAISEMVAQELGL